MDSFESQWLGCWRGALLGALTNIDDIVAVQKATDTLLDKADVAGLNRELVQVCKINP